MDYYTGLNIIIIQGVSQPCGTAYNLRGIPNWPLNLKIPNLPEKIPNW